MQGLTPAIISSVIAYLLTSACALLLVRRRFNNKRLRLLTMVIGMMPFLQAIMLLSERGLLQFGLSNEIPDLIDLFVSMLCLWSIHLLDVEIRDRQRMDVKLRLVESEAQKA
jgi:ABC-type glycerol-3-phosphate transport system permease component